MPFMPSLGSAWDDGMKRSGSRASASVPTPSGSPTPINPLSTPHRSISRNVTATGSSTSRNVLSGTSLNMYSTGNSNSSLDWESLVCRVMNR